MKVIHIAYQTLPDIQGASIRTRDLVSSLPKNIKQYVVSSPFQKPFTEGKKVERYSQITYLRTRPSYYRGTISQSYKGIIHRFFKLALFPLFVIKLTCFFRRFKPDIVHAHATFFCFYAAKIALFLTRSPAPLIYEVRSLWYLNDNFNGPQKLQSKVIEYLEKKAFSMSDHLLVINEYLKDYINKQGICLTKLDVIPNGINSNNVNAGEALQYPKAIEHIAYIGGLNTYEGVSLMIDAFKILKSEVPHLRFSIYGGGAEEQYVLKNKGEVIHYHGKFSQCELIDIYDNVDLVVLPRVSNVITENVTPLKPLEVITYKRFLILSDVGGHKQLFDGIESDIYFKSDSVSHMVDKLKEVIDLVPDSLAKEYNEIRSFVIKNRHWENSAKKLVIVYERLAK